MSTNLDKIKIVAQVLGHKDKEATKGYISVSEKMLRSCAMDMPMLTGTKEVHYDKNEL